MFYDILDAAVLLTVGSFLLTVELFDLQSTTLVFVTYSFCFLTYNWSFFAYSGKVRLIRALRDCQQRNLTVSKKTPNVSTKTSPYPDPPILTFLAKKRGSPEKKRGFSSLQNPWNPWKREQKRTKKQGKPQNEKSEENEKKARIRGSGYFKEHDF